MSDETAKPSQAEGEDPARPGSGDAPETAGHPSQAEGEDTDGDGHGVEGPEDRGAPSAEYDIEVSEREGVTRVDIADDAVARPGPGPGQPEADVE
ncbi:hypothetical protein KZX37_10400 [Microbacterium sp. EYE_5]|uniref:hypothetical protein n=1 Tax=unclassified Microbacterium TaxID=2609290 RepID=UPI0020063259|nr:MULTISPECIES: hypothetical protein [unclassified Microbacterium]MCK6081074.1 hypothetical protein [Microbacterium sp. EYE_382]MCK6086344.1 hypothetical protein [Microbacterium sp. EYE_384]MCK6124158.1 hypothetical protein [Microbacterium sp. EYE_80]MCK6127067.1 hypothetical protein [Microbacterium sp. EYE_79]MCK6142029.1 hypothetical protein [Microbacterium sp. EYE_39]